MSASESLTSVTCGNCGAKLSVPKYCLDIEMNCPQCFEVVRPLSPSRQVQSGPVVAEKIDRLEFGCDACGRVLSVEPDEFPLMEGKPFECPSCGERGTVPCRCNNCGELIQAGRACSHCGTETPSPLRLRQRQDSPGSTVRMAPPASPAYAPRNYEAGPRSAHYCSRCGAEADSDSTFCSQCGEAIFPQSTLAFREPRDRRPQLRSYAGFWKRFCAAFIDGVITIIGIPVIVVVIGALLIAADLDGLSAPEMMGFILGSCVSWLYYSLMESSGTQGTLGKMALGIKVTDLHGDRIGFGQATGRHLGKVLSALIFCIGFLMIAFTERKQGLHDMMAGCLVIDR